jgi:hypothetical protein
VTLAIIAGAHVLDPLALAAFNGLPDTTPCVRASGSTFP